MSKDGQERARGETENVLYFRDFIVIVHHLPIQNKLVDHHRLVVLLNLNMNSYIFL